MPPALFRLLKMRGRALLRSIGKSLKKPSGILFAIVVVIWAAFSLLPILLFGFTGGPADPEPIHQFGPAILLTATVFNIAAVGHIMRFSASEIDMLFPAPFSRRQLLTYKCATMLFSAMLFGVGLSIVLLRTMDTWLFGFIALTMAVAFANLLGMSLVFVKDFIQQLLHTRQRKLIAVLLSLILLLLVFRQMPVDPATEPVAALRAVVESPVISALSQPFRVFVIMLTAESVVTFAPAALLALLMCIAAFELGVRIDARNLAARVDQDTRYHQQLERLKKSSGMPLAYSAASTRWRIPPLPWLSGAGPVLHRQLTTALRAMRSLILTIGLQVAIFAFLIAGMARESAEAAVGLAIAWIAMLAVITSHMVPFDFRGDLDHIDSLKLLPIAPMPMAAAQVVTPTLITTLCQAALLLFAFLVIPNASPTLFLAVAALLAPMNFLYITLENAMFLTYPTRMNAGGLANIATFGRSMLLFIARVVILMLIAGLTALVGWIAWWVAGESLAAATLAAAFTLIAAGVFNIFLIAKLFENFDISRDLPA